MRRRGAPLHPHLHAVVVRNGVQVGELAGLWCTMAVCSFRCNEGSHSHQHGECAPGHVAVSARVPASVARADLHRAVRHKENVRAAQHKGCVQGRLC